MLTYGADVSSMAPSHLETARRTIAKAVAPGAGGKAAAAVLYVADGAGGTLDPAFDAHVLPLQSWALALWQQWAPVKELEAALRRALELHPPDRPTKWRKGAGPVAAMLAAARRLGWSVHDHRLFTTDVGERLDLLLDPPCVIAQAARRVVRRWRLAGLGQLLPALIPAKPDIVVRGDRSGQTPAGWQEHVLDFADVLGGLLGSRGSKAGQRAFAPWDSKFRADLRSAATGGQWPQARLAAVPGWTDTSLCQLCKQAKGTLQHRHTCGATMPPGGWPLPAAQATGIRDRLDSGRQLLLQTRGLHVCKISAPRARNMTLSHGSSRCLLTVMPMS